MARINVNINPNILLWAREEAGFSIEEISHKLSINKERYCNWERFGKEIPLGKLQRISTCYKRQLAVFMLPKVPNKIKKPHDFRNLKLDDPTLSKDVLLTLRRTYHLQNIATELVGEYYWQNRLQWLKEIESLNTDEELIIFLRNKLSISIDTQIKWRSDSEAYKNWRTAIEDKLGILVFQFSMPINEIQGFCITDNYPYIIVTNSKHSYTGRIFTLFHELAHILKHQSGMCIVDDVEKSQTEEWACNSFSANFLIPRDKIVQTNELKNIEKLSKKLNVSREAYLRRLYGENLISDFKFFDLLKEIKETYKDIKKKNNGFALPEVKSKASRGETFYNIIFDSINSNKINYTDAAHALDLRVNRLVNELQ